MEARCPHRAGRYVPQADCAGWGHLTSKVGGFSNRRCYQHPLTMTFSHAELARYQRHLTLAGFGPAGQEKLKAAQGKAAKK